MAKLGHLDEIDFHELADGFYNCTVCGRPTPNAKFMVELHGGGGVIWSAAEGDCPQDGGYMGVWPIGSSCAKKFAGGVLQVVGV